MLNHLLSLVSFVSSRFMHPDYRNNVQLLSLVLLPAATEANSRGGKHRRRRPFSRGTLTIKCYELSRFGQHRRSPSARGRGRRFQSASRARQSRVQVHRRHGVAELKLGFDGALKFLRLRLVGPLLDHQDRVAAAQRLVLRQDVVAAAGKAFMTGNEGDYDLTETEDSEKYTMVNISEAYIPNYTFQVTELLRLCIFE